MKKDLLEIKRLLRKILKNQERLLQQESAILSEEHSVEQQEGALTQQAQTLEEAEQGQLSELKELEEIERAIERDVKVSPLSKVTSRDFTKAIVGAFFGVVGHFAFFYGTEIASELSVGRATILYIVSFMLALLFMYFTGFRRVDKRIWKYMPLRVLTVYFTSLLVIILVLAIFGFIDGQTEPSLIYRIVGSISILAVLGASAADLIGRE
ncbi:hypothetical protein D6789_03470 [Candidatus Woesearchaeota archaeon]|nr:MAG: hypothetical protein D6789_03470 [Candidatus Woesearchaeota archaeon]